MDASGDTKKKRKRSEGENEWEMAQLKENTELHMDMQTGELSLQNPESDTERETSKSTSTGKVAYYCAEKGGGMAQEKSPSRRRDTRMGRRQQSHQAKAEKTQGKDREEDEISLNFKSDNDEEIEERRLAVSMKLLWALRYDTEDWAMGKKWKDCYSLTKRSSKHTTSAKMGNRWGGSMADRGERHKTVRGISSTRREGGKIEAQSR